jgi:hypothetical protein
MVRNGNNVSICIWYQMAMVRNGYGTKMFFTMVRNDCNSFSQSTRGFHFLSFECPENWLEIIDLFILKNMGAAIIDVRVCPPLVKCQNIMFSGFIDTLMYGFNFIQNINLITLFSYAWKETKKKKKCMKFYQIKTSEYLNFFIWKKSFMRNLI